MIAGVADTHTAIWHLFDDPRLSQAARKFIDDAAAKRGASRWTCTQI
jgi:PIN domain nuclease of toxin-antitoxin system